MPEAHFIALDVHKTYVMIGAVNGDQEIVLTPRRVALTSLETWCQKYLDATDEVVLEATTNAWHIHDLLEPLVARVVVAHPYHVKLIASSFVKTDKRATLALARLLAANVIPAIWVPQHVRELRSVVAHYHRLVSQQTATRNRLQAVLHRHHITPPEGSLFTAVNRDCSAMEILEHPIVEYHHDRETRKHEQETTEFHGPVQVRDRVGRATREKDGSLDLPRTRYLRRVARSHPFGLQLSHG